MQSYHKLLRHILNNGEPHKDRTGVGTTSVFGYEWRHNMSVGFPLITTKRLPFRWVAEELFWFLSGSTNEKDLRDRGVDIWKEWATEEQCAKFGRAEGDLGPVYGALWRNFDCGVQSNGNGHLDNLGIDQISHLMHNIERTPESRRLIVTGWHPLDCQRVTLPPCHTLWQVKCHGDDEISLRLDARSIDAFLGLPFNIASYGLLLELIAATTNRKARELIIQFGDLHIYDNHHEQCIEQLIRTPYPLPRLSISDSLKGAGLKGLLSCTTNYVELTQYQYHPPIKADVAV